MHPELTNEAARARAAELRREAELARRAVGAGVEALASPVLRPGSARRPWLLLRLLPRRA